MVTCASCDRELCGRGGKSPGAPTAGPCVALQRCGQPGVLRCFDCSQGAALRERGDAWLPCADGEKCASAEGVPATLSGEERARKGASCAACGAAPICRRCRPAHDKACNPGAKRGAAERSSGSEAESEGGGGGGKGRGRGRPSGASEAAEEEAAGGSGKKRGRR